MTLRSARAPNARSTCWMDASFPTSRADMKFADTFQFASGSLRGSPSRTLLMMLAMSIGVAAVVVLTALGEGARGYVVNQFASLGTNLVIVLPGRTETAGLGPGVLLGQTPRDITLDDAQALL